MNATVTTRRLPVATLLRLGRVSNLPTVWTNVLAATVLAGGDPTSARTASVLISMTLFYVGGMYLNDAFDRTIDARERPNRPIPSGQISAPAVFSAGVVMLGAGTIVMSLHGPAAGLAGLALAIAVLLYDLYHKGNPLSPVMMGVCRALVYVGAAIVASGAATPPVLIAATAVLAHVVGLTYAAKQESLDRIDRLWPLAVLVVPLVLTAPTLILTWPAAMAWAALAVADVVAVNALRTRPTSGAVPGAVAALIAAISLLDALVVAPASPAVAAACFAGYGLTRLLHRVVPGT